MAKSIEDRAITWSEQHRDIYMCNTDVIAELSYKQGAIDQRKIDIDKACEWLYNDLANLSESVRRGIVSDFRKSLENEN